MSAEIIGAGAMLAGLKKGVIFIPIALLAIISRVAAEHNPDHGWLVLFKTIVKFALFAIPAGTISGGLAFNHFNDIWIAMAISSFVGAVSPDLLLWIINKDWKPFVNRIIDRFLK